MGALLDRLKTIKEKEQKQLVKKQKAEQKKLEKLQKKQEEEFERKKQESIALKNKYSKQEEIEEDTKSQYAELSEALKNVFKHLYLHDYTEYKDVIVAWDDSYSKIPFKIIDDMPNPEDLKLIHYQDECLWLLWKTGAIIPKAYLEGEDFENDRRQETYITIFESKYE